MSARILQAQIEIDKPLDAVFSYISNLKNLPFWGEVDGVETEGEGEHIVYTAFNKNLLSVTKIPLQITNVQRPNVFAFQDLKNFASFTYELEELPEGGTKVGVTYELDAGVSFTILNFGGAMQGRLEHLLKNLKRRVESQRGVDTSLDDEKPENV